MYAFNYHRPATLQEAAALAAKSAESRLLAGGQSLVQAMRLRLAAPSDVIDLGSLRELSGIRIAGGAIEIGAMTRHAEVAESSALPALAALAGQIGDRQVRHLGTLGGSLANNDPAADYPAAVLALGATIVTNRRRIEGDRFFKGLYETALEPGEIITAVSFPIPQRAAYVKFKQPASRFALVGVFVAQAQDAVRVAVTGAKACAFRLPEMEQALARSFAPEALAQLRIDPEGMNADLHASAAYRAHLVSVMAKRAVQAALA